jgi:hypothetical protein
MGASERFRAAETYVKALRSGEATAAIRLNAMTADDVVAIVSDKEITGKVAVLEHVTGDWPSTPALNLGGYSDPTEESDGTYVVSGELFNLGASPKALSFRFSFDANDRISRVEETYVAPPRLEPAKEIPLLVRAIINNALAIGRPIVVAYVDEDGRPNQSLRGSVQVFSPTQICFWARPGGHLADALAKNPIYRDSSTRTTLIVKGTARVASDDATRLRVYELGPEVEPRHDPAMGGNAVIVDVAEIRGSTPQGAVTVVP